ncbi:MAG: peptidoglycan editing factor PgeF [Endomicrobium sp.]|jgi:YfiH family protein|nr:peptidoglycan editing factor PgeF [Endomicrobium sp.]
MKDKYIRDSFLRSLVLDSADLVLADQIHGNNVRIVKHSDKNTFIENCDGLITDDKSILLGIFTADCIPILISSRDGEIKAAVHAGWRGILSGIVENTVGILKKNFCVSAKNIMVYIGPHIRSCCYKTGAEMEVKFNIRLVNGKLDLTSILYDKLKKCGINEIFDIEQCTFHNKELFFSYRRDCCTDRLLSVI